MLLFLSAALAAPDIALVGNSYTQANGLDRVLAELLTAGNEAPTVSALAIPGYTFAQHVAEAQTDGTRHDTVLVDRNPPYNWLVLQEQSQIPGFPESEASLQESLAAAAGLDGYARAAGADTLFLMTWGRRDGDSANPELYPDFLTMQAMLAEGYLRYVSTTSEPERTTFVAPAGYAFRAVYEADVAAGRDPRAEGSDFAALYQADGSHPSPEGTYLVACVLFSVLTGNSPVGVPYDAGLEDAARLQEVAAEVVFTESPEITYPWEVGVPDSEMDSTPDSNPDSDPDSTPDSAEDVDLDDDSGSGCGCASTSAPTWGLLGLLGLLRRQRPT